MAGQQTILLTEASMAKAKNPSKIQYTTAQRAEAKRKAKAAKALARAKRAEAKAEARATAEARREASLIAEATREAEARATREAKAQAEAEATRLATQAERIEAQAALIRLRNSQAREWVVIVRFLGGAHDVRPHKVGEPLPKGYREARASVAVRGKLPALRFGGRDGAESLAERISAKLGPVARRA